MGKKNDEVERLMRLREQQLKARDPHAKQIKIQRKVAARRRKKKKRITFQEILTDVPHKWQGVAIGVLVGMIIWIVLPLVVEASWIDYVGLAAIVFLPLLGFAFGQAFDVRDELRELLDE